MNGVSYMKISLIGAGPGKETLISLEGDKLIKEADILIGADRIIKTFGAGKPGFNIVRAEDIVDKIKNTGIGKNVAVLLTGDPGFYSSAKKLFKLLDSDEALKGIEINVVPGISSLQYFLENMHLSWENVVLKSLHGRKGNLIGSIRDNPKVFSLFGKGEEIRETAEKLHYYGMDQVKIIIGERLSYPDENIIFTLPERFLYEGTVPDKLSAALFINENAEGPQSGSIEDNEFIRGDVPMTKEEIRTLSLSKLRLKKDSVVYDIGAGTGSVSVEAALKAVEGEVYAIEKRDTAIELINKNRRKFAADNIRIVKGIAPEAFSELPPPDRAFIGGSGGKLEKILEALFLRNPEVRIVMNIVSLDTLGELNSIIKGKGLKSSVTLISISRAEEAGEHSIMKGFNPVYVVTLSK